MTYWKKQERRIKAILEDRGWKRTRRNPGSGAGPLPEHRNDVYGEWNDYLHLEVDHKSTKGQKSATIPRADLQKCRRLAQAVGDVPLLTFGYYQKHDLYGIMPLEHILTLLEHAPPEAIEELTNGTN